MSQAIPEGAEALFDSHTHVFTSDTDTYPTQVRDARDTAYVISQRVMHDPMTPERLLRIWDENDVSAGVVVQYGAVYETDNKFVLDASDLFPARLSAVVILDADNPASPAKLKDYITQRSIVGLRLFGFTDGDYSWLDSEAALKTWQVAADHNLSIAIMYVPSGPTPAALDRIAALAPRFPGIKITLDHFAWPGHDDERAGPSPALLVLRDQPNIYFKFTTINFRDFAKDGVDARKFLRRAADTYGAERMMWGSDIGNTQRSYPEMISLVREATALLRPVERRQFLYETGKNLFSRRA
jgi:predicted TIM-barrel fold metal-dependent hydrolase